MTIKSFKKCCISNKLDDNEKDTLFGNDSNEAECSITEIENAYHDDPMSTKDFCELFGESDTESDLESV